MSDKDKSALRLVKPVLHHRKPVLAALSNNDTVYEPAPKGGFIYRKSGKFIFLKGDRGVAGSSPDDTVVPCRHRL